MKIIFFVVFPEINAGSRYRVYKFLPYLKADNIEYRICPPMSNRLFKHLYQSSNPAKKFLFYLLTFIRRGFQILIVCNYDIVFIHQGLTYFGPPVFERIISKLNRNIIFDTDDAHFIRPSFATGFAARFHDRDRIAKLSKMAKHVIVSVDFLRSYIREYNAHITVIPTSIDLANYTAKISYSDNPTVVIGWAGSSSGLVYLDLIKDVLKQLARQYKISFKIISSAFIDIPDVEVIKCRWDLKSEISQLQSLDIGIMPLFQTDFERGKGGFKLIQYMGVGLPVVCTPIGVNTELVRDGDNGFLAKTEKEWFEKLSLLINDADMREKMGKKARTSIKGNYTIESNAQRFIATIKAVVQSESIS